MRNTRQTVLCRSSRANRVQLRPVVTSYQIIGYKIHPPMRSQSDRNVAHGAPIGGTDIPQYQHHFLWTTIHARSFVNWSSYGNVIFADISSGDVWTSFVKDVVVVECLAVGISQCRIGQIVIQKGSAQACGFKRMNEEVYTQHSTAWGFVLRATRSSSVTIYWRSPVGVASYAHGVRVVSGDDDQRLLLLFVG